MAKATYREIFPKRHTFLPVIHVTTSEQAYQNTRIALDNGADGVFLINHGISATKLLECYRDVREWCHLNTWIGLNFLGQRRAQALRLAEEAGGVSGLWSDTGADDDYERSYLNAREFFVQLQASSFEGLYFGGVEFKGRNQSSDPARMARLLAPYMDAVTTSGPETGTPPSLHKITTMRAAIPDGIMANASGLGPDDVDPYLPHLNCFLVASKISKSFHELDPPKVSVFAKKMER